MVLAGGDGSRLLPMSLAMSGDERREQFCRMPGGETLLEETRRRINTNDIVKLRSPQQYSVSCDNIRACLTMS